MSEPENVRYMYEIRVGDLVEVFDNGNFHDDNEVFIGKRGIAVDSYYNGFIVRFLEPVKYYEEIVTQHQIAGIALKLVTNFSQDAL